MNLNAIFILLFQDYFEEEFIKIYLFYKRNYLINGLSNAKKDDLILFSDADEIPNPKILDEYNIKKIDFLSLDVEGYELNVLKGLNLNVNRPTYMLIEVYDTDYDNIVNLFDNLYNDNSLLHLHSKNSRKSVILDYRWQDYIKRSAAQGMD